MITGGAKRNATRRIVLRNFNHHVEGCDFSYCCSRCVWWQSFAPYAYHPDAYDAAPEPFDFGFQTADEFGTQLSRQESGDASGAVSGSYGYADANGIWRKVTYTADAGGFRAQVDTNEPGTDSKNTADVTVNANPAPAPVVYKHPVVKHVIPAAHVYAPYTHPVVKAVKVH
ncbi:cuticle protein 14-like [Tachypleus tridentatus]|uniref:cuticle protein 14-like n=1 Tax=Tachypleus tridentatus TaxID=6853 RepID=UPI003FCEE67A